MNFTAIDFETANYQPSSACSIGIVEVREGEVCDEFYSLITPVPFHFVGKMIEIHGIRPHHVENAPNFGELWPQISRFFHHHTVIAHCASFDMNVLRGSLSAHGKKPGNFDVFCSYIAAKRAIAGLKSYSLGKLANHLCIEFKHHHALEDARACALVMLESFRRTHTTDFGDFCESVGAQIGKMTNDDYHAPRFKRKS